MFTPLSPDRRIERPGYAWVAVALQAFTAVGAIPVGFALLTDTTGRSVGLPGGWIEATPFGSYLVPGLYLLLMNGLGMLIAAGLIVARHRWAPGLTAILGAGLVIWIAVQVVVLPETSLLQVVFGLTGLALTSIGVAWLRRTEQLAMA